MKKKHFFLMSLLAMAMSFTCVSCGDDDDNNSNGNSGGSGEQIDKPTNDNPALSTNDQKKLLESTAQTLVSKVKAVDFQEISDVFRSLDNNPIEDENGVLDQWLDDIEDACKVSETDKATKFLWKASNFYGQFEASKGNWVKTGSAKGNVTFTFTDNYNAKCVAKITYSGSETTIHHELLDTEDDWYEYDPAYGGYIWHDITRINRAAIPQQVTLTLTRSGKELVKVTLNTKVNVSSSDGEVDLTKDKLDVTLTTTVQNYKVVVEKLQYNMEGGNDNTASALAKVYINNELLITVAADAKGTVYNSEKDPIGKQANVAADVLGKVQLRGTINNINQFCDYNDEIDDNCYDEQKVRRLVDLQNGLFEMGLYFNGSSNKSCEVKLMAVQSDYYYYDQYWKSEAYIKFTDGSAYQTFEEYFDEYTYDNVISQVEDLIDDFVEMFE